jgi:hypothetical protein
VIAVTDAVHPVDPPVSKYAHLPEPVRLEDTVTSAEAQAIPDEKDDYWREVEWMLRVSGGG